MNTQKKKSWKPKIAAATQHRHRERDREQREAAPAPELPRQERERQERGCRRLLGEGREREGRARRRGSPARAQHHRRGHQRQHEHLEVGGLRVLRAERGRGEEVEHADRDVDVPAREAAARLGREQQGGQRVREDREHAHRGEVVGAGDRERGRVEVGHHRRLAVDRVRVEVAAVVDDLRFGREVRLVGVEHVVRVGRDAQQRGEREEPEEQHHQAQPRAGRARGCVVHRSPVANTTITMIPSPTR